MHSIEYYDSELKERFFISFFNAGYPFSYKTIIPTKYKKDSMKFDMYTAESIINFIYEKDKYDRYVNMMVI